MHVVQFNLLTDLLLALLTCVVFAECETLKCCAKQAKLDVRWERVMAKGSPSLQDGCSVSPMSFEIRVVE